MHSPWTVTAVSVSSLVRVYGYGRGRVDPVHLPSHLVVRIEFATPEARCSASLLGREFDGPSFFVDAPHFPATTGEDMKTPRREKV